MTSISAQFVRTALRSASGPRSSPILVNAPRHCIASTSARPARSPAVASTFAASRSFHISKQAPNYHFDTHHLVSRLEESGIPRQQAEGLMEALEDVVRESVDNVVQGLVTRAEQEKHQYTQKVDFAKLKSEIALLSSKDFQVLKTENERLLNDVERLRQRLREEITRTQSGVRLDLNLEKGRMRDELSQRELKIREVDTRIESEISGLRTQMESAKFQAMQYVVGVVTGSAALLLAYLRMVM